MSRRSRNKTRNGVNLSTAIGRGALIGGALFVLSLAVGVFALLSYAKGYLRSAAFRDKVSSEISRALKADAKVDSVRWEGSSAYTDRFRATGYQDASFALAELSGFRAELDLRSAQLRRGVWKIPEILINQADLDFSAQEKRPQTFPVSAKTVPDSTDAASPKPKSGSGLIRSLIPDRVEIDSVRISNLNLLWTEGKGPKSEAIGMQALITPTPSMDAFKVEIRRGSVRRPGQEKVEVDRIDLHLKNGDVFLSEALLRTTSGAEIRVEGDITKGGQGKPGSVLLRANIDHLQAQDVVADAWTQRVRGDLRVTAKIEGDPAHPDQLSQTGTITLDKGMLEAFPVLETLATYTGSERFRRLALRDGASAQFKRIGNRTVVENIDIQSDGLARLTGNLLVDGKALSGKLRLGVIPGSASWLPGAEQTVFLLTENGYIWTDINLSGTVDAPQNDLVPKLAAAGVKTAIETMQSPAAIKESVEGAVKGAVGVGRDLLNGFLGR
ncbi:MAG: hypothetical protein DVB23_000431 [Verrucomicrobia bacterium]|jgi:hypothetical protein|nr:MAG: hypothetical protein DVB23_000431 [Verrucomicrobiota bacterium]